MGNNSHYWKNKENLSTEAVIHTKIMTRDFNKEIKYSIDNSILYGGPNNSPQPKNINKNTKFIFYNGTTQEAIFKFYTKNLSVLNFASYKYPGGGFLAGSSAQEEMLCHNSFLYNVISTFKDYYNWNNEHKNKALYLDRAIYSPEIYFFNKKKQFAKVSVITCAAPNFGAANQYQNINREENYEILKNRINFIKKIAEENNTDTLILGAFGCGVFKQPPEDVSNLIYKIFENSSIPKIIIAVPGKDHNMEIFRKKFEKN